MKAGFAFEVRLVFGTRGDMVGPFIGENRNGRAFHVARLIPMLRSTPGFTIEAEDHHHISGSVEVAAGEREVACHRGL